MNLPIKAKIRVYNENNIAINSEILAGKQLDIYDRDMNLIAITPEYYLTCDEKKLILFIPASMKNLFLSDITIYESLFKNFEFGGDQRKILFAIETFLMEKKKKRTLIISYKDVHLIRNMIISLCLQLKMNIINKSFFTDKTIEKVELEEKNNIFFKESSNFSIKILVNKKNVMFKDICGYEDIKKTLENIFISPKKYSSIYEKMNIIKSKNIIIHGPTGCGKTLFAKAIANEIQCNYYEIRSSNIISRWMGETGKNVEKIFEEARINQPSVIIIDNIDSFGYNSVYIHDIRMINTFLLELDRILPEDEIYFIGLSQRKECISLQLLSPGRFDRVITLGFPNKETRYELIKKSLLPVSFDKNDLKNLVNITNGFSCADIIHVISQGKENAILNDLDKCEVLINHIIEAINNFGHHLID